METEDAKFLENGQVNGSEEWQNLDIKEIKVNASLPIIKEVKINISLPINVHSSIVVPNIAPVVVENPSNNEQSHNKNTFNEETNPQMFDANKSKEVPLRRSQKIRKLVIPSDY